MVSDSQNKEESKTETLSSTDDNQSLDSNDPREQMRILLEQKKTTSSHFTELCSQDGSKHGWTDITSATHRKNSDLKVEYKFEEDTGLKLIRATTTIDIVQPKDVFDGWSDWTLVKKFDEMCLKIQLIRQATEDSRILYGCYKTPWPLSNRELITFEFREMDEDESVAQVVSRSLPEQWVQHHLEGDQSLEEQQKKRQALEKETTALLNSLTLHTDEQGRPIPKPNDNDEDSELSGIAGDACFRPSSMSLKEIREQHCGSHRVRMFLHVGGFQCRKIDEKQSKLTYMVCVDPAGWIPQWVVNLVAPKQGENLLKVKEHVKDEVQRRREELTERLAKQGVDMAEYD